MKALKIVAALSISSLANATESQSVADVYSANYSIESVEGNIPIRAVVVKRSSESIVVYTGFGFDCTSKVFSQTGFYSSKESVLAQVAKIGRVDAPESDLTILARKQACEANQPLGANVSDARPDES
ncbi:hypothetical protein [Pseudomonas sp. F01002]|uniref:hypothetical protein n=1 Tax=Pseudomonas sp. F01002 TaxID=2555724 RepID=UPI00106B5753|nr:hypothetical protein [Pseudomonas sp. F01002]TFB40922.1 hypothetical protein E3W21_12875 [Pseudomonas sp. F01002]